MLQLQSSVRLTSEHLMVDYWRYQASAHHDFACCAILGELAWPCLTCLFVTQFRSMFVGKQTRVCNKHLEHLTCQRALSAANKQMVINEHAA